MCFCERDAVNVMIHVKARKHYPGIRYHEETLGAVARQFNLTSTFQLHAMSEPELADLSKALLRSLPADARPREYRAAV